MTLFPYYTFAMMWVTMHSRLLLLSIPITITALFFGLFFYISKRVSTDGKIRVETSQNSNVFIDSSFKGSSPFEETLKAKEYTIKIVPESQLDKLVPWQGKATVYPGRLTYINVDMSTSELFTAVDTIWLDKISRSEAELTVVTIPEGAVIKIDDVERGTSPVTLTDLPEGDHIVQMNLAGFLSRQAKIKITNGYRVNVLTKLPMISTAMISISEEKLPDPTPTALVLGSQTQKVIEIKDTPTGFLRVRSSPSTGASESAKVKPKDRFSVLDEKDGWYKIEFATNALGWVSGKYVDLVTP